MATRHGFTLLEALVALVLLSVILVPLLGLNQANLDGISRLADVGARIEAERNALSTMDGLNPAERPSGEVALTETMTLRWEARPITPRTRGVSYPLGTSPWFVTLYEIDVTLSRPANNAWHRFTFRKMGYERIESQIFR